MTSKEDRFRGRLAVAFVGSESPTETPILMTATATATATARQTDPHHRRLGQGQLVVEVGGSSADATAARTTATAPSFVAAYTMKDVLLYALAVGYGDVTSTNGSIDRHDDDYGDDTRRGRRQSFQQQYERDLRHVYEGHPRFSVLPTFGLALPFLATAPAKEVVSASAFEAEGATVAATSAPGLGTLPPFPPPFLRHLLGDHLLSRGTPILHTWQSIAWNHDAPGENNGATSGAWQVPSRHHHDGRGGGEEEEVALASVSSWIESVVDASAAPSAGTASAASNSKTDTKPASSSPSSSSGGVRGGGTFFTARTVVRQEQRAVCEMEAKFLVVGRRGQNERVDGSTVRGTRARTGPDTVPSPSPSPSTPTSTSSSSRAELPAPFTWEKSWRVGWNAALLYRLGSGDTNSIHVVGIPSPNNKTRPPRDPKRSEPARDRPLKVERPIVHGLCTMGHVTRILEQHYDVDSTFCQPDGGGAQDRPPSLDVEWRRLECRFVNPVHVGDELHVRVREEVRRRGSPRVSVGTSVEVTFCVYKTIVGGGGDGGGHGHLHLHGPHAVVVVVDRGYAALVVRSEEDKEDDPTGTKARATTPRSCALGPTSRL